MARYRKLLVAVVGVVALFVPEVAGMEDEATNIYDAVVSILTAFGVWRVPNEPPTRP